MGSLRPGCPEPEIKTNVARLNWMTDRLEDLRASVAYAPHPYPPNDYYEEPIVRISTGRGNVEVHEVLDDDMPVVQRKLREPCYVVQTYHDGELSMQVLTFGGTDAIVVARAFTAWIAERGSMT